MSETNTLTSDMFMRIAEVILSRAYDESNIMKLISAILILMKIDENKSHIIIEYVRSRVSENIKQRVININNIYDILYELIHLANNYRRSQNRKTN